jgi:HD-GYP domain-containing protein (c-di-GMP phosphodiesterase class II)
MTAENRRADNAAIREIVAKLRQTISIAAFVIVVLFAIILRYVSLADSPYLTFLPKLSVTVIMWITIFLAAVGFFLAVRTAKQVIRIIRDYRGRFERILGIMKDLREEIYGDILLEKIMDHAIAITGSDAGAILLVDGGDLAFKTVRGEKEGKLVGTAVEKGKGVAGWVAKNGVTLRIADTSADSRFEPDVDSLTTEKAKSVLCAPLRTRSGVLGVIELMHGKDGYSYRERDEEIIVYLAEQAAFSIHRTKFLEDQKNYEIHLTDMLLEAIDFQVPSKKGHSRRVAAYGNIIAKGLNMTDGERRRLYFGSLLHDVGFLKIDSGLAFKKEDFSRHPVIGYEMIKPINFYADIASFILHHHERYDGHGYPAKLKGEQIPIEARIIAIAESFDAMTSEASYRITISFSEAIEELKRSAGTQFDPELIGIFVNNVEPQHMA